MDQAGNNGPLTGRTAAGRETTAIRAQIARTRAQMTDTLGELQDRLRPDHLADQARDAVREAVGSRLKRVSSSASQAGRRVAAQTRTSARQLQAQAQDHPALAGGIAAALVGLAAAMIARRRRGARTVPPIVPAVLIGAAGYYALAQAATRRPDEAERVTRIAAAFGRDVGAAGQRAVHGASAAGQRAVGGAVRGARDWADEHPMVIGGAALLAGVVAGTALPVLTVPSWRPRAPR